MKNGKIVVGVLAPSIKDASAMYRSAGPFTALLSPGATKSWSTLTPHKIFEVRFLGGAGWPVLYDVDIIYMPRPCGTQAVDIANLAKRNGVKLWMDWDDHPWRIMPGSGFPFTPAEMVVYTEQLLDVADAVSTTTEYCARLLGSKTRAPVTVIPNACDLAWFRKVTGNGPSQVSCKDDIRILWRGGGSQKTNIEFYRAAFDNLKDKGRNITLMFQGLDPTIKPFSTDCRQMRMPFVGIPDYLKVMSNQQPDIGLVLHSPDEANLCRSKSAWIEYAYCGAYVIAPDTEEWKGLPGSVNYRAGSVDSYTETLEKVLDGSRKDWKKGLDGLTEVHNIHEVNQLRIKLMLDLVRHK